ncbi:hypothetical protein [Nocardia sp. CY41]|uniref:hypothetical protein n=1 Tax=Nocardia sp. CY41 TaxID=2608686 RepID=UPI003FA5D2A7
MVGFQLKRRHHLEFAVYVWVPQAAWRLLPDRLLLLPLTYNRLQYEKLVRYHRKYALDSFAPPSGAAGGCPI